MSLEKITEAVNVNSLSPIQARELQNLLNKHGYNLITDGVVGNRTRSALADFKTKQFLGYPDMIGATTLEVLNEFRKPLKPKTPVAVGEQLTPNFYLSEMLISQTASRMRLDNRPTEAVKRNLKLVAEKVLQPVRNHYNKPVVITSGYRSPAVNRAVGGSVSSQHMLGQAVDFTVPSVDNYSVALWIRDNLKYDQLILEFYTGGNSGWIHVGYSPSHRMQVLTINRFGSFNGLKKY